MFTDSLAAIAAAMRGEDDAPDAGERAAAGLDVLAERMMADYQRKLAKWERDAPMREAAVAAQTRASIRRRLELGVAQGAPVPIAAALDWMKPDPPVMW